MELAEHIEKAKQMVSMLRDDIIQAYNVVAARPEPSEGISVLDKRLIPLPKGFSIQDKALAAYLMETLELVTSLERKLDLL